MNFREIPVFVTQDERAYFLSKITDTDWHQHRSTASGQLSPLQYKRIVYRGIEAGLMKMDANAIQDWHTDGVNLKRSTVIIHPLTDNYSPFKSKQGESVHPIIADTQQDHAVFNNNNVRMNLQIPFDVDYNDALDYNSVVSKTLRRFYGE